MVVQPLPQPPVPMLHSPAGGDIFLNISACSRGGGAVTEEIHVLCAAGTCPSCPYPLIFSLHSLQVPLVGKPPCAWLCQHWSCSLQCPGVTLPKNCIHGWNCLSASILQALEPRPGDAHLLFCVLWINKKLQASSSLNPQESLLLSPGSFGANIRESAALFGSFS